MSQHRAEPGTAPRIAALVARYGEPQRHYHTRRHLRAVLAALHRWLGPELPEALFWAALCHDAVYDPTKNDNEAQSALLLPHDLPYRDRAVALVLATQTHTLPDDSMEAKAFLDADLWVLGATRRTYDRYARLIRTEYAHVPDAAYRAGRAAVLERFLGRPRLYHGDHPAREAQARKNLQRELARLR